MSSKERQQEILRILLSRRRETMRNLAEELRVTQRTIANDITALTLSYPIETTRGHCGCVRLADWYRPSRQHLCPEQIRALEEAAPLLQGKSRQALLSILEQFR